MPAGALLLAPAAAGLHALWNVILGGESSVLIAAGLAAAFLHELCHRAVRD